MNSNLGKPLSKKEMRAVQGGKLPGCAAKDQKADDQRNGDPAANEADVGTALCALKYIPPPEHDHARADNADHHQQQDKRALMGRQAWCERGTRGRPGRARRGSCR